MCIGMEGYAFVAGDCLTETLGGKTAENGGFSVGRGDRGGGGLLGGCMETAAIAAHGLGAHAVAEGTA